MSRLARRDLDAKRERPTSSTTSIRQHPKRRALGTPHQRISLHSGYFRAHTVDLPPRSQATSPPPAPCRLHSLSRLAPTTRASPSQQSESAHIHDGTKESNTCLCRSPDVRGSCPSYRLKHSGPVLIQRRSSSPRYGGNSSSRGSHGRGSAHANTASHPRSAPRRLQTKSCRSVHGTGSARVARHAGEHSDARDGAGAPSWRMLLRQGGKAERLECMEAVREVCFVQ